MTAKSNYAWTMVLFASVAYAQVSYPATPRNTTIDSPRVKVRELTIAPHQSVSSGDHPLNRVLVFREAGEMKFGPNGKMKKVDFEMGDARWYPAGAPYEMENITDHLLELVIVELEGSPSPSAKSLTNLDMLVVDPQHYKLVFENDQVRVLRVHYPAHEKGALHEHVRSRVIVNLNNDLRNKYGDVRLMQPETHAEENKSDEAADRLVVEAK